MTTPTTRSTNTAALVLGASGSQGHYATRAFLSSGYSPVYGATSSPPSSPLWQSIVERGAQPIQIDLSSVKSIQSVLEETKAEAFFIVTTMDLPPPDAAYGGLKTAEEKEYEAIIAFFHTLIEVYERDRIPRHVIFSSQEDVEKLNETHSFIRPLDDGSVVPHYSGKGRAGEYALKLLDKYDDVTITLLTLPFLHENILGASIPLPDEGKTQWTISAAFGDAAIDMLSVSDLEYIIPPILANKDKYTAYNLKVSAEKITFREIASIFSDLFGKDVIYNPLTVEEMSSLPIAGAPAMAQMCQFLSSPHANHDIELTASVMAPRTPQLFKDWLLTHSDAPEFDEIGLTSEAEDILIVTVFGATSPQGRSVIRGLLNDKRKRYTIRATSRDITQPKALEIQNIDHQRITLVQADFDDFESCLEAVEGSDGAFLTTEFKYDVDSDPIEEEHAKHIIDACEASKTVRHLVFSAFETIQEMHSHYQQHQDGGGTDQVVPQPFDAKARAAAYARTKKLSCTFVSMPLYSEQFLEFLKPVKEQTESGETNWVMKVPTSSDAKLMCMSVEELGPAVAKIFDSYQVFAGHEIGLVTDFVTMSEAAEIIEDVFFSEEQTPNIEKKEVSMEQWLEKKDTNAKDLGQIFSYCANSDAVKERKKAAKTLKLVPDARPLREWMERNRDNVELREKLGLR